MPGHAWVLLLSDLGQVLNSWDERKWGALSPKERKSEQGSHVTQIIQCTSFWQVVPRKRPPGALFCWPLSSLAWTALWLVSHSCDLLIVGFTSVETARIWLWNLNFTCHLGGQSLRGNSTWRWADAWWEVNVCCKYLAWCLENWTGF